jgi:hypothetical protein
MRRTSAIVALLLGAIALAACSDSSTPANDAAPSTTSTTAPVATTGPSSTTSTLPSLVVTVKGVGGRVVPMPASVPLPAIVHAQHAGSGGSFAVTGIDSHGRRTSVLASSFGTYNGTFAVGFVDPADNPTTRLHVITSGAWQLDIASATLAPPLGSGREGIGDTVLSYRGRGATAHLTYEGHERLTVNVYEHGGVISLVDTKGPYDGVVSLIGGPAFIAVTTSGKWSMMIE